MSRYIWDVYYNLELYLLDRLYMCIWSKANFLEYNNRQQAPEKHMQNEHIWGSNLFT